MAYAVLSDVKTYLGASSTTDDALLSRLLKAAQNEIDRFCRRSFEASTQTRTYNRFYLRRAAYNMLYLDADLLTITSLTNGNGIVIPTDGTGYWLEPQNEPPYQAIRLKSAYVWTWNTDGQVSVVGTWGYTTTAPADITEACIELTAYLYRLKDASTFDVTALPEMGQLTIPKGWPQHVKVDLEAYRRTEYGA